LMNCSQERPVKERKLFSLFW